MPNHLSVAWSLWRDDIDLMGALGRTEDISSSGKVTVDQQEACCVPFLSQLQLQNGGVLVVVSIKQYSILLYFLYFAKFHDAEQGSSGEECEMDNGYVAHFSSPSSTLHFRTSTPISALPLPLPSHKRPQVMLMADGKDKLAQLGCPPPTQNSKKKGNPPPSPNGNMCPARLKAAFQ